MAHDTILSSPRSLLLNRIEEQARSRMARGPAGSMATFLVFLELTMQLKMQCVPPLHVGGCSCREPTPEIDNRLQEVGGNPAPATKTRTHTLLHHLRLTLKEKTQPTKRDLYKEPILGQDYQDHKSDLTPKLPSL